MSIEVGMSFVDAMDGSRVHVVGVGGGFVDLKTDRQMETGKGGVSLPLRMFEHDVAYGEYVRERSQS